MSATPSRADLGRIVMVMPTYNESLNLEWIVGRLRAAEPDVDVLVVDDGSPDGTGRIADAARRRRPARQGRAPDAEGRASARRTGPASGSPSTRGTT